MSTKKPTRTGQNRTWTVLDDAEMCLRYAKCEELKDIGEAIGRSVSAIGKRISVLARSGDQAANAAQAARKQCCPVWTKERDKRLLEMLDAGNTTAEIADELGSRPSTIRWRKKWLNAQPGRVLVDRTTQEQRIAMSQPWWKNGPRGRWIDGLGVLS